MFHTHYTPIIAKGENNFSPSVTVPDQSMTIQEIIARYTRTGTLPVPSFPSDTGGNEAFEPGFDPLDYQPDQIVQSLALPKAKDETKPAEGVPDKPDTETAGKTPENGV